MRVAVTRAAGSVSARPVEWLTGSDGVDSVAAFDAHLLNASQPKVSALRQEIREPIADILREHGVDAVVHLSFLLGPYRRNELT